MSTSKYKVSSNSAPKSLYQYRKGHRKDTSDHNTSVLTQYSHVIVRPRIIKEEVIKKFDVTVTSDQNTSIDDLSCIDETSEISNPLLEAKNGKRKRGRPRKSVSTSVQELSDSKDTISIGSKTKSSYDWIELHDWIIKPLPDLKGVCVEGQKKGMKEFWHSSAISDVKNKKFVRTASGTLYRLRGKLNKLCALENGFSKTVVNEFIDGFPSDWKRVLDKFYAGLEKSICVNEETSTHYIKHMKIAKIKKKLSASKKREKEISDLHAVLTPVGLVMRSDSVQNFTTTRSGRLSLPPLAHWQGQRYVVSSNSNTLTVGFQTAEAEKSLLKETSDIMKRLPNKSRKEWRSKAEGRTFEFNTTLPASFKSKNPKKKSPLSEKESVDCDTCDTSEEVNVKGLKNRSLQHFINDEYISDKVVKNGLPLRRWPQVVLENCKASKSILTQTLSQRENDDDYLENTDDNDSAIFTEPAPCISKKNGSERRNEPDKDECTDLSPGVLDCSMVLRNRTITRFDLIEDLREDDCNKKSKNNNKNSKDSLLIVNKNNKKDTSIKSKTYNKKTKADSDSAKAKPVTKTDNDKRGTKRKLDETFTSPSVEDAGYFTEETATTSSMATDTAMKGEGGRTLVSTPKSCGRPQVKKRRKLSLNNNNNSNGVTEVHTDTDEQWTVAEKRLFKRALKTVDASCYDFWYKVAEIVDSRSEEECQEYHTVYLEGKTKTVPVKVKSQKASKPTARQKGGPVLGRKGTMKRKTNMREYLKEFDENYEDDLFMGTPFASKKLPSLGNIDFDKNDSQIFGSNHNFITPLTKGMKGATPCTQIRAQLASARKTPEHLMSKPSGGFGDTPNSAVRKQADKHIYAYMNRMKKNVQDSGQGSQLQAEITNPNKASPLPMQSLFTPSIIVYDKKRPFDELNGEEDDDNQCTYYWGDDDD